MPRDVTRSNHGDLLLLGSSLVLAGGAGIALSEARIGGVLAIVGVLIGIRRYRKPLAARSVGASPYRNMPRARTKPVGDGAELLLAGLLIVIGVLGFALNGTARPAAACLELIALFVGGRLFYLMCAPRRA